MALKTVNITGQLYNPDGTPAANATGTAVLTKLEIDNGTVVPSVVSFTTDETGLLDINLWPNERGQAGSRYRLRAKTAKNGIVDTMITVPDSDVPIGLDDVIEAVPYPPVEYSKKILEQAQAAVDSVQIKEQEREQIFEDAQDERENEFSASQIDKQNRFNDFIAASGYQFLGDYAAGIEITEYNQIVRDSDGEFWRLSGEVELPYTTTGAGLPEDDSLTPLGDAVLRQELAGPGGAAMVAYGDGTISSFLATLGTAAFRPEWFFQLSSPGSRNKTDKSFCDRLQALNPVHEQYIWDDMSGSGYIRIGFRFDDSYLAEYRYSPDADGFVRLQQVKIGKGALHPNGVIILNDSGSVIRYAHDNSVLEFALNVRAVGETHPHTWVPRHGSDAGVTSNQSGRWMVDGLTRFTLPTEPEACKSVVYLQSYDAHNAADSATTLWSGLISYALDSSGLRVDHRFKPNAPIEVYQGYLSMLPARNELYSLVVGSLPQRAAGIPVSGSQPVFESTLWGDSGMFLSGAFQAGRYSGWAIDVGDIHTSMGDYFTPGGNKNIQIYDRDDGISKLYYPFSKGQVLSNTSVIRSVNRYYCAPAMRPPVASYLI